MDRDYTDTCCLLLFLEMFQLDPPMCKSCVRRFPKIDGKKFMEKKRKKETKNNRSVVMWCRVDIFSRLLTGWAGQQGLHSRRWKWADEHVARVHH